MTNTNTETPTEPTEPPANDAQLLVRLPADLRKKAAQAAAAHGDTLSGLVRAALKAYVDAHEVAEEPTDFVCQWVADPAAEPDYTDEPADNDGRPDEGDGESGPPRVAPSPQDEETLTGTDAIDFAEEHGLTLSKHEDPIEEARDGLTVEEAREVASEDPALIYVEYVKRRALGVPYFENA